MRDIGVVSDIVSGGPKCQPPECFFGSSHEHTHIQPDNLEILVNHLKCAAFELPILLMSGGARISERLQQSAQNVERDFDRAAPDSSSTLHTWEHLMHLRGAKRQTTR